MEKFEKYTFLLRKDEDRELIEQLNLATSGDYGISPLIRDILREYFSLYPANQKAADLRLTPKELEDLTSGRGS